MNDQLKYIDSGYDSWKHDKFVEEYEKRLIEKENSKTFLDKAANIGGKVATVGLILTGFIVCKGMHNLFKVAANDSKTK